MKKIWQKSLASMVSAALCLTAFVGCLTVNAADYQGTITSKGATVTTEATQATVTLTLSSPDAAMNVAAIAATSKYGTLVSVTENEDGYYIDDNKLLSEGKFFVDANNNAVGFKTANVVLTFEKGAEVAEGTYPVTVTYYAGESAATWTEKTVNLAVNGAINITVNASTPVCDHANATYDYSVVDGNCITKLVCPDCGNVETVATIANVDKLGHAPVLASGLSINFRIPLANLTNYTSDTVNYSDVYAVFNKEGFYESTLGEIDSTSETVYGQINGTNLQFSFTGISAKQMNNKIDTRIYGVYNGHVVLIASEEDYSLVTYIKTMYNSSAVLNAQAGTKNAAFRTLLVDLANYGAKAQTYLSYNIDSLANADIPQTYASETPTSYSNVLKTSGINIRRAPELGNKVLVNVRVNQADVSAYGENFKFVVSYKDTTGASFTQNIAYSDLVANGSAWQFTFDKISAATMAVPFTITLFDGDDNEIGMLEYSIESYAQTVSDGAEKYPAYAKVLPLTQSLVAYGRSADAYFNFAS